jgi:tetratricopeptide (TPR) repeat protein
MAPPVGKRKHGPEDSTVPERHAVSLCMIVKNEQANLGACLGSVHGLVSDIVVVDTGSVDGTQEIARRCGARVFDFPWRDDFAAARNESVAHASGSWILWLDADDRLEVGSRDKLASLLSALPSTPDGYLMRCISTGATGLAAQEVAHARLFRNDPRIRFRYRVHEQVAPSIRLAGGELRETNIAIRHEGYSDPALCRTKQLRNLRLIELECGDRPLDPFFLYYRGVTLLDLDRAAEAVVSLQLCASLIPRGTMLARMLPVHLAEAYGREGLARDARDALDVAHLDYPADPAIAFALASSAYRAGDLGVAEGALTAYFVASRTEPPSATLGDPTISRFRARQLLAIVRYVQGRYVEAEGDVREVVDTCPEVGDGWLLLGDSLFAQGKLGELAALTANLEAKPGTYIARVLLGASQRAGAGDLAGGLELLDVALGAHGSHPYLLRARDRLNQRATEREVWRHASYFLSARDLPGPPVDGVGGTSGLSLSL